MPQTFVYAIYCPNKNEIKIGYATDPLKRLASLQTGTTDRLDILLTFVGGIIEEKKLHDKLNDYRRSGEWFSYNEKVREELLKAISDMYPISKKEVILHKHTKNYNYQCLIEVASSFSKQFTIPEIKQKLPELDLITKQIEKILLLNNFSFKQYGTSRKKYFYLSTKQTSAA